MTVAEAKIRIGDIRNLALLLGWPLGDSLLDFAFWRGNESTPALSFTPDWRGWKDHATGKHGDMVALLAEIERISVGDACRRIVAIAEGVATPPPPIVISPRASPAEKRAKWPYFSPLPEEAEFNLARRRNLPHFAGIRAASRRGLLFSATVFDAGTIFPQLAWGLTDSSRVAAQVRRMDGKLWAKAGKTKSLPGSMGGWPIGAADVGNRSHIVLTEGEPDLLSALTLYCLANPDPVTQVPSDPGFLAFASMCGASKRIAESALPLFAGKTVTLIPHSDEAGSRSAETWREQLRAAGATVRTFDLRGLNNDAGQQAKDLNEVVTARGWNAYRSDLIQILQ